MARRLSLQAAAVIDPQAYAARIDVALPADKLREQAAKLIAEAILSAGGMVSVWRACPVCGHFFKAGGWPLPGHERANRLYCSQECKDVAAQRRHRAKKRKATKRRKRLAG